MTTTSASPGTKEGALVRSLGLPELTLAGLGIILGAGVYALIGAAATVLQQLTVGRDAIIGAGAVVTKAVPDGVVVTGVPGVWR